MTKRLFHLTLFLFISLSIPLTATAQIVDIPDPNLRAAIEYELGNPLAGTAITVADMETLTALDASNANINDLTGLEHAINLTILDLGAKFLGDHSINSNSISDLSPLAGLTNLTELWLRKNAISDISAVIGLTNLEALDLGTNSISDLSPLAGLTNLTTLVLRRNSISDLSPVAGLTDLTWLDLGDNLISDLAPLAGLTQLTLLGLWDNSISDISALAGLTQLTLLWINNNAISDIAPLAGLTQLTELNLTNNSISDLAPLVTNTGLGSHDIVGVNGNPLNDASINSHIPTLQSSGVTVEFDNIIVRPEDIAQTVDIPDPKLRAKIAYARRKASDATITMADIITLTELRAPNANISDLTGLEHATNLTSLELDINFISDLSPLVANTGLGNGDYVNVLGNPLNAASINTHIPALQSRGVIVEFDNIVVRPEDIARTVDIPDSNLRSTIEYERGKASGAPITVADMMLLIELFAPSSNISDLTGLEHATNLTELQFRYNNITDLSPLAGLTNLTDLNLINNSITDLSPLVGLTELEILFLQDNSISDISPLVANTGLGDGDWVDVSGNPLNALSINTHIPTLQSREVTVGFNNTVLRPEDIAKTVDIPDLNLRAAIADTRGRAQGAAITVADMETLSDLSAPNANISDLTGLQAATNLIFLDLGAESVEGQRININSISDISPLVGLTNLIGLLLSNNSISDISAVIRLTNLGLLDLDSNFITDISAVTRLTNLIALGLHNNNITDVSAITGLTNLEILTLGNNSISDISALAGLTNLTKLSLYNNSISNLSPLVENTGLGRGDWVDVTGNPLNVRSINTHIPTLQSRGVIVEFDDIVAQPVDVNGDGVVNILDLVSVASQFGKQGQNLAADVNRDGVVNILDLVSVAGMFGEGAAAPSAQPQAAEMLTAASVRGWLTDAKTLEITDPIMERGVVVLQQLLASLTPTETELLANYPNPFNPETWIPYRLAEDAFVTLTIYDKAGRVVRTLDVGHRIASAYENRSKAIYWDGRNQVGERVASGVYFYHLSARDYSATRKMLILK